MLGRGGWGKCGNAHRAHFPAQHAIAILTLNNFVSPTHPPADLLDALPDFELAFTGSEAAASAASAGAGVGGAAGGSGDGAGGGGDGSGSGWAAYYHTQATRDLNARFGDLLYKIQDLEVWARAWRRGCGGGATKTGHVGTNVMWAGGDGGGGVCGGGAEVACVRGTRRRCVCVWGETGRNWEAFGGAFRLSDCPSALMMITRRGYRQGTLLAEMAARLLAAHGAPLQRAAAAAAELDCLLALAALAAEGGGGGAGGGYCRPQVTADNVLTVVNGASAYRTR